MKRLRLIVVTAQYRDRQNYREQHKTNECEGVERVGDDLSMEIGVCYSYGILCYCVNRGILKER